MGDLPESDPASNYGHNKFLGFKGEGHRGILVSLRLDALMGIMLAQTESLNPLDGITHNRYYVVAETDPEQWPSACGMLDHIPQDADWVNVNNPLFLHG